MSKKRQKARRIIAMVAAGVLLLSTLAAIAFSVFS